MPFKIIGAPWINGSTLLNRMLPYLTETDLIDTITFIPSDLPGKSMNPKYENQICHGLRIHHLEDPIGWTIQLLNNLNFLYSEEFYFLPSHFIDKLYGSDELRLAITNAHHSIEELKEKWEIEKFYKMSKKYYLYD